VFVSFQRIAQSAGCLVQFEEIKAMEPAKYIGDSFERVSRILVVTLYNIACCYSSLEAADAGLEALEECLRSGFDDYDKVRSPSLFMLAQFACLNLKFWLETYLLKTS
jgi:hypothetical protein